MVGRELDKDETNWLVLKKGWQPPLGTTHRSSRDSIRAIYGTVAFAYLQVSTDGGPLNNHIFLEKQMVNEEKYTSTKFIIFMR